MDLGLEVLILKRSMGDDNDKDANNADIKFLHGDLNDYYPKHFI